MGIRLDEMPVIGIAANLAGFVPYTPEKFPGSNQHCRGRRYNTYTEVSCSIMILTAVSFKWKRSPAAASPFDFLALNTAVFSLPPSTEPVVRAFWIQDSVSGRWEILVPQIIRQIPEVIAVIEGGVERAIL